MLETKPKSRKNMVLWRELRSFLQLGYAYALADVEPKSHFDVGKLRKIQFDDLEKAGE